MKPLYVALTCQVLLLLYHQTTTFVDFYPFNGARFYSSREKAAEMAINAVLMVLAIVGTARKQPALFHYAVIYYFVLLAIELIIWWVPYFVRLSGLWRKAYNLTLALGSSDFAPGDALVRWEQVYERIHAKTITLLPRAKARITPNVEHMILHAGTLVTALATAVAYMRA
jgi:hypothetical protein